jgi:very-short-patch-repair endonuclease
VRLGFSMRNQVAPPDLLVARIAARQHGVVTTRQLAASGVDKPAVVRRVRSGRLHRLHRGVYAVGHARLSNEGRWMAAIVACGEAAVLSHRSAAALWELLPPPPGPVEITIPGGGGRPMRPGIRRHRSRSLTSALTTSRKGIPVTTPARTVADLRRVESPERLQKAIRQAAVLGLDIGEDVESDPTRSELERRFLRLCRRHRLPAPEVNAGIGAFVVDFVWRRRRLIVETDGYRYHRGRQAFEDDRVRDIELRLLGYEVLRFTHRQVVNDSATVAAALRSRLEQPVAADSPPSEGEESTNCPPPGGQIGWRGA